MKFLPSRLAAAGTVDDRTGPAPLSARGEGAVQGRPLQEQDGLAVGDAPVADHDEGLGEGRFEGLDVLAVRRDAAAGPVLPWEAISGLITDETPHHPVLERLAARGVDVLTAG
ncbi:hypothetical protein [Nonomuraea candida]|uniref:hypothetical protein n=1 Tax=Nonomuraea candida TaxID=359159 RepID=UPI0005BD09A9|nr:hypothetical protein [Nonomuraea candida]